MMALPTSVQRSLQLCPTGKSLIKKINKKRKEEEEVGGKQAAGPPHKSPTFGQGEGSQEVD